MCEFADEPTLSEGDGVQVTDRERAFYRALLEYEPLVLTAPSTLGGRILGAAVMGFTARDHVERHHAGRVDEYAEKAAPRAEPERAAWLFGYRWQP